MVAVSAAGCMGQIEGEESTDQGMGNLPPGSLPPSMPSTDGLPPPPPATSACANARPNTETSAVRRLNRREYVNTIRDLVGATPNLAARFPSDPQQTFDNDAALLVASSTLVEMQFESAETIAAGANLTTLVPCKPAAGAEPTCAGQFIQTFGRRAYRRPLGTEEAAVMQRLFTRSQAAGDTFEVSMRLLVQSFIQAPQFLYRLESSATATGGVVAVGPYELASRLSFFIWASMPDETLLKAAAGNTLASRTDVEAQVRRMLADPKARGMVTSFHDLWLELDLLDGVNKDQKLFASFPTLRPLFKQETQKFTDAIFWGSNDRYTRLLKSDVAVVNPALAQFYGLAAPSGAAFESVPVGVSPRFGVLTQGSVLSMLANPDRNSPTKRGHWIREQLLCQTLAAPPSDVAPLPTAANATMRERLAQHRKDPACSSCHALTDELGFGLENYDPIGKYRTTEAGKVVDASGELIAVSGNAGKFRGAGELADRLVTTGELRDCVATQWFRFAVGRREGDRDSCSVEGVRRTFAEKGGSLRELIVSIARSDAFLDLQTEKAQ